MAKWANALVLDGGSDLIRTRAATTSRVKMHVVKAYSAGDSYATVLGNSCASVDMTPSDYVQSTAGSNRVTTVAAKAGLTVGAASGGTPNLHIAHVDSVSSDVLYVTDETTDHVLLVSDLVNVSSHTLTMNQPI